MESFRVSALFSYFSQEEIEKMEKLQKLNWIRRKCKNASFEKSILLKRTIKTTESIVDSVSEYNLERNNNSQIFMNELL